MDSESAPKLNAYEIRDETMREIVAETFSAEYRHGYYLREILRSEKGWTCIWERTLESYGKGFDWTPVASPEEP